MAIIVQDEKYLIIAPRRIKLPSVNKCNDIKHILLGKQHFVEYNMCKH